MGYSYSISVKKEARTAHMCVTALCVQLNSHMGFVFRAAKGEGNKIPGPQVNWTAPEVSIR